MLLFLLFSFPLLSQIKGWKTIYINNINLFQSGFHLCFHIKYYYTIVSEVNNSSCPVSVLTLLLTASHMADGPLQLLCKLGFSGTILTALPLIVSLLRRVFFIQTLNVSRLSPMRRETGLFRYCSHFMSHPSDGLPLTLSTTMSPDLVNGILRTGCKQKLYEVAPSHSGKKKYSL